MTGSIYLALQAHGSVFHHRRKSMAATEGHNLGENEGHRSGLTAVITASVAEVKQVALGSANLYGDPTGGLR